MKRYTPNPLRFIPGSLRALRLLLGGATLAALVLSSLVASAHPYASAITNTAGTISWYLNEAATDVKIVYSGNGTATHDLGAVNTVGVQTFSLTYNSVTYPNYSIVVNNSGAGTWSEEATTASSPTLTWFRRPVGVTVNNNAKTTRTIANRTADRQRSPRTPEDQESRRTRHRRRGQLLRGSPRA